MKNDQTTMELGKIWHNCEPCDVNPCAIKNDQTTILELAPFKAG
jgi:hypothetical protein